MNLAAFSLSGLEAMSQALDICKFDVVPLKGGASRGAHGACEHEHASLCSFFFDFSLHGRFHVPQDQYLLCFFHEVADGSWCAGQPVGSGDVLLMSASSTCELALRTQSKVTVMLAPTHLGIASAMQHGSSPLGGTGRMLSLFDLPSHAGSRLQACFESAFYRLIGGDGALDDAFFDQLLEPWMLDKLAGHTPVPLSGQGSNAAHYRSLRKVVDFMHANLHRDIYIEELANAACMSDRGLRYVFNHLLGVSPTSYLALLRLHEARRRLSAPHVRKRSVKNVAMSCGFWDLSRFANYYRQAFGENPRATLVRAQSHV